MNLASVGVLQGNGAVYGRLLGGCFTLDFDSATACVTQLQMLYQTSPLRCACSDKIMNRMTDQVFLLYMMEKNHAVT
jgi:hypothetical protein